MDYPCFIEVDGKRYPINTNFKVAIKCNEIAENDKIGKMERSLAIIYLLFGEEALNDYKHYDKILELALKYLLCGKEKVPNDGEPDMSFTEDYSYIKASFRSDYGMDIDKEDIHWWEFCDLMNGLSNSEMGNCCILNRVRRLRNYDISKIKDDKERQEYQKMKEQIALKRNKKELNLTEKQLQSMEELNKIIGIE